MKRMLLALCALVLLFSFPAIAAARGCGAACSCGYIPSCPPCVILPATPTTPVADVPVTGGAGLIAWLLLLGGAAAWCAGKNRPV